MASLAATGWSGEDAGQVPCPRLGQGQGQHHTRPVFVGELSTLLYPEVSRRDLQANLVTSPWVRTGLPSTRIPRNGGTASKIKTAHWG